MPLLTLVSAYICRSPSFRTSRINKFYIESCQFSKRTSYVWIIESLMFIFELFPDILPVLIRHGFVRLKAFYGHM